MEDTAEDYIYARFYDLDEIPGAKTTDGITLSLYVVGKRDINILLSPTLFPKYGSKAYEFGQLGDLGVEINVFR